MSDERLVGMMAEAMRSPSVEFITGEESFEYVMARSALAALRENGFAVLPASPELEDFLKRDRGAGAPKDRSASVRSLSIAADVLRRQGWEDCGTCDGNGWEALPPFDGTVERTSNPCPDCVDGLMPPDDLLDVAFNAYWRHLPDHMNVWSAVHVRALRAALVAAARKDNE